MQLTQWYGDSRLSPEQAANLMRLLDPLAATVVYSYEYPLDAHHGVQPGETLDQIASHYSVERQTLAKINGLSNQQLQPGQQLKVLQGPFHALVDLSDHELSLVVGGRYAGRFPLSVGQDFPQQEGRYTVLAKTQQPSAAASSGSAGGPSSGYWIALDGSLGFHIAPDPNGIGRTGGPGFLGLREQDLAELFDLLSVGSTVVVRP